MDIFSATFLTSILSIVIIDLVLAGDNAIVIGMAARNVPKKMQKTVIIWGTIGAVIIRSLGTLAVVWLLKIPGLMLIGGLLLVWISYKLLVDDKSHDDIKAADSVMGAIWTIIIADMVMGLDNVLAVAGAAHGEFILVILGLAISVPIVVWGSTIILKWMERYPVIIYIGAGVLAYTAAKMIVQEPFIKDFFASPVIKYGFEILVIAVILLLGRMKNQKRLQENH